MGEQYGRTVRDLLPEKLERIDEVVKEELSREPGMGEASIPGFVWEVAGSKATEAVRNVLDCDAFGLLARAWAKARELREYAGKQPQNKEATAYLVEHSVVTNVHPIVEVSLLDLGRTRLRFTLELAADFRAAELRILAGRIIAIGAGDCSASAQLKYGEVKLHNELKTLDLKLSGTIALDPPLTIG